jgi:predicted protein tyrosine phosphatase
MALRTVLFCSQKVAQARPAWSGWAVISVTSAIASPADLQEGWAHILRLAFDDIDIHEEPYILFSEQQARNVIKFAAMCHSEGIEGILVHCAAGISRSAAIAKWIADRYQLPFNDNYMLYNKHVHTTLREEHMLEGFEK